MNHFLDKCANYIFNQHSLSELANIAIILPTRRGTVMFKKSIGLQADKPFIAPKIVSIEDFILQTTNLQLMEPIDLVFELFNAIRKVDETVKFELFMSWAPTLLKDFESIDQYLVDANHLFSFMTEAKAMERWNLTEINSRNLNINTSVDKYFELFKNLHLVYIGFNEALATKGLAYRGSAYRYLAEKIESLLINNANYYKYYFIGFNALSLSESKILKALVVAKKAETLWDTDTYYMGSQASNQLAGRFLKSLKKEAIFGPEWKWQENNLLTQPKKIQIVGVNNASLQPLVMANYLQNWANEQPLANSTAVILADEMMLGMVVNQIPAEAGKYNITMGLTFKATPIYDLIERLFDVYLGTNLNETEVSKYNTRLIIKLLKHTYIKNYCLLHGVDLSKIISNILEKNTLFISFSEIAHFFAGDALFELLFHNTGNTAKNIINHIADVSKILFNTIAESSEMDLLYFYQFNKIISRVTEIVDKNEQNISVYGLKSILFEIMRQTKLPFESDAQDGLQIMGMLETRTLDFEKIILIAANEGNLPSGKKSQSLIPFDALVELKMPTYGHQDAIMAYHFFRLLQRAKEVVIIYTKPNAANGNKEKSRFILQIEHELAMLNSNIKIEYPVFELQYESNEKHGADFKIEKTDEIIENILANLTTKGLSTTAMNEYIACQMQYYFNRIAKIKEPSEIDENIGNDVFGTWIHKTLENIDKEIIKNGGIVEIATLKEIKLNIRKRLEADFKENNKTLSVEEGMNLILLNVAEKVLDMFFTSQINSDEFPQVTIGAEKELSTSIPIIINGKNHLVKIYGKIDKISKYGNTLKIVDYKTGLVDAKMLNPKFKDDFESNTLQILNEKKLDKFRQLWLYRYLVISTTDADLRKILNNSDMNIQAGIYSFRNNVDGFLTSPTFLSNSAETDIEFLHYSEEILTQFIHGLLDKNIPFEMTADSKTCEYCNYKGICNR